MGTGPPKSGSTQEWKLLKKILEVLIIFEIFVVLSKTLRNFHCVFILGERSQPVWSHFEDAGVLNLAHRERARAKFSK